jgi:peptidoglycan hydrolase CwlO-like protein
VDTPVLVAIISSLSAVFCGFMVWRSSGRATNVNEQAAQLSWVKEIRQDATDARKEVEALQEQVRTLRRQLDSAIREADHWISQYQAVHRTAWRPGVTIDHLRDMLGPSAPQINGRG